MANLKSFDTVTRSNAGVEMELKDLRTGKGSGAFILLLGRDSDEYTQIKTERSRMITDRIEAGDKSELSPEELDALGVDMLARCTKGWRGLENGSGELAYSFDAAKDLYRHYPAIREQVNVFIGDRANFVQA